MSAWTLALAILGLLVAALAVLGVGVAGGAQLARTHRVLGTSIALMTIPVVMALVVGGAYLIAG